jgi:hypothetical protein
MVQVPFEVAMAHYKNGGKVYVEYGGKKREVTTPNGFVSFPVELMKKGLWFIE